MPSRVKTPKARTAAVRNVMKANRRVDTKPELRLRSQIHKSGLRYAMDVRPESDINRRADLVFRSAKVAVFVHGCFWHGCPKHHKLPKSNKKFWAQKVRRNRERDQETQRLLRKRGWKVLVFWEHQEAQVCADKVNVCVRQRRRLSA
jgi:DNA mismatch endonuclease (patch repair protein)